MPDVFLMISYVFLRILAGWLAGRIPYTFLRISYVLLRIPYVLLRILYVFLRILAGWLAGRADRIPYVFSRFPEGFLLFS